MSKPVWPACADLAQLLAEHNGDELKLADLGHRPLRHRLAIPHDRHPVADGVQLVEAVGNEEDRDAVPLQAANHREEGLHLVLIEGRGRLIEHDELAGKGEGAGQRHHLLQRHVQLVEGAGDVE